MIHPPTDPLRAHIFSSRHEEASNQLYEAIALYNAADATQLTLTKGAVVTLVAKTTDEWWTVRSDRAQGFFPGKSTSWSEANTITRRRIWFRLTDNASVGVF